MGIGTVRPLYERRTQIKYTLMDNLTLKLSEKITGLNAKLKKFLTLKFIKSWIASKYTNQQT